MKTMAIALILICMATVAFAGCTAGPPAAAPLPSPTPVVTGVPATPADATSCTSAGDCVPAQCCHPASCTNKASAPPCENKLCTMSCEGPIDCGSGACGCVNGRCSVIPAQASAGHTAQKVSVRLEAFPQRYSPMMSSTPGIGLTPNVTGFIAANTDYAGNATDIKWNAITYEWNATYGSFLTWDAPDYKVHQIGNPVATDGKTIYWTFMEKPASNKEPVVITVTARDMTRRGAVLGTSAVTLSWDGDYAVYVTDIR
ncbi:MAG: hypothetical protein OS112_10405 [Methanoregula sp.]|nr:MAG: hypothetical protein OS112_10405 [Methanoregula sp.]